MNHLLPINLSCRLHRLGHHIEWRTIGRHTRYGLCINCSRTILIEHERNGSRHWMRGPALKVSCDHLAVPVERRQARRKPGIDVDSLLCEPNMHLLVSALRIPVRQVRYIAEEQEV